MSKASPLPKTRNREETARTILEAARAVLSDDGFAGFGINAIARRAGCDKQLVYRYFGGLEGLIDAIGADLADWVDRNLAPQAALPPAKTYAELVERLSFGFIDALRADALMCKILVWELSDSSAEIRRLNDARSRALAAWMQRTRGDLAPPPGVDAAAANAVILAAIQHLVLASVSSGQFAGIDLSNEEGWTRIRALVRRVIESCYT